MDDFEYEDFHDDDDNGSDGGKSLKDRYDEGKEKYDSAKEKRDKRNAEKNNPDKKNIDDAKQFNQKNRAASNSGEKLGQEAAKETGKEAVKETGKEVAKKTGKEAGKAAAKETGKAAAKETGKVVAKEGTKAAVKTTVAASGTVTAGAGTLAALLIEIADRANEVRKKLDKKINDKIKENTAIDLKVAKRLFCIGVLLIPFLFIFFFLIAGTMYLASENTYEDLYAIIQKREKRYAESGKTTKLLMLMTNDEIDEILKKDYKADKDFCYKSYLKEKYKKDFDNFIPSDGNDKDSTYAEKLSIIEKYLKAGRENFNKINWKLEGSDEEIVLKDYNLTGKDSIITDPGFLKMPDLDKYQASEGASNEQMKNMYIDMVHIYLQHWVIPYALNIASQDNNFGKSVLEDMWHPIDVTLFELDRRTKTTTEKYYILTSVIETISTFTPGVYNPATRTVTPGTTTYEYNSYPSDTSVKWVNKTVGNVTYTYNVTKLKNGEGGYIAVDPEKPYSSVPVTVDEPYRHVPKTTYIEGLYNIITDKFKIKPIDESNPPTEETETTIDENGVKIIVEVWHEDLESVSQKIEKYKLSYLPETKYTDEDRTIARIEWYIDAGLGDYEMYPEKSEATKKKIFETYYSQDEGKTPPLIQGYSYDDLHFGFIQIDKYYKILEAVNLSGVSSGVIDIGDIPIDGFAWPVDLNQSPGSAVVGYIYGTTYAYGGNHKGIDIKHGGTISTQGNITMGPSIVASHDGIVSDAKMIYGSDSSGIDGNQIGYGNYVKLETEDGKFMTVYAHLSSVSVTTGQKVTRGQVIGNMGTTGNSSGVHLHYEIRHNGSSDDPLLYYITEPEYGSYPDRIATPVGYYRFAGSISSGISNNDVSTGLKGFLLNAEGKGPMVGDKYEAYDDGFGNITIGMGITWKDHKPEFNAAGIYSMEKGDLVDASIVEKIEKNDIAKRVANINSILASNGINDLKQHQIDALTSYHYNVGNIDKFPAAWKEHGMTDGLWTDFFSKPVTANGIVVDNLVKRREAEYELFTTGNYAAKIYDR